MTEEHPFAQYVRIIGRGPNLSRPMTEDEMYDAAGMIMRDEIEDLQLGAFLCILRLRTEVPEEGLGFVRAARDTETYNLERKPLVFSVFGWLADATR